MARFAPDATYLCYRDLTPEALTAAGITALILDIDNTLAPYEQPEPDEAIRAWLAGLAAAGIRAGFLSNNHGERVTLFNETLGLPVLFNAKKPLRGKARRLMDMLGATPATTAFLGDQIFTDIWTAHRAGARGFLVPPIRDKKDFLTRFKRQLEKGVLRRYYKKHPDAPDVRRGSPLAEEQS